ncbi:MAG: arsenate reductase ArsC [Anaerolineales bacterium]|jgi:arsenate reductase
MKKSRVLFLCTGNSARSQMSEAFLRKYAGDRFDVFSAGLDPKGINPYTYKVMQEKGLSLNGQRSKSVKEYLANEFFHYVITVCANAEENCPTVFLGMGNHAHWNLEDPAAFFGSDEETLNKFREVRDQIEIKIKSWIEDLDRY